MALFGSPCLAPPARGAVRHSMQALALCLPLVTTPAAQAQADPACYVVNQILQWLEPRASPVPCAAPRAPAAAPAAPRSTTPPPQRP